jgi:hypothetical protein
MAPKRLVASPKPAHLIKDRMPQSTNRVPAPGEAVLAYSYLRRSYEDRPTGIVYETTGPAVGGGFYIFLDTQSLLVVESYDEKIKAWIERPPGAK